MSTDHCPPNAASATRDRVVAQIKAIVAEEAGVNAADIQGEDELEADLGCDSLTLMEILMEVEDHFGIDVPDDIGERIRTVDDIADGVVELLEGSSG